MFILYSSGASRLMPRLALLGNLFSLPFVDLLNVVDIGNLKVMVELSSRDKDESSVANQMTALRAQYVDNVSEYCRKVLTSLHGLENNSNDQELVASNMSKFNDDMS